MKNCRKVAMRCGLLAMRLRRGVDGRQNLVEGGGRLLRLTDRHLLERLGSSSWQRRNVPLFWSEQRMLVGGCWSHFVPVGTNRHLVTRLRNRKSNERYGRIATSLQSGLLSRAKYAKDKMNYESEDHDSEERCKKRASNDKGVVFVH
jgi:hypothetical protein